MNTQTDHATVAYDTSQVINAALTDLLAKNISTEEYLKIVDDAVNIVARSLAAKAQTDASTVEVEMPKYTRPKFGSHPSHCCARHGCKYGDNDCPVVIELVAQDYPCESCRSVAEIDEEIAYLQEERAFTLRRTMGK